MRLYATQHLAIFTSSQKGSHCRLLKILTLDAWLLVSEIILAALFFVGLYKKDSSKQLSTYQIVAENLFQWLLFSLPFLPNTLSNNFFSQEGFDI